MAVLATNRPKRIWMFRKGTFQSMCLPTALLGLRLRRALHHPRRDTVVLISHGHPCLRRTTILQGTGALSQLLVLTQIEQSHNIRPLQQNSSEDGKE